METTSNSMLSGNSNDLFKLIVISWHISVIAPPLAPDLWILPSPHGVESVIAREKREKKKKERNGVISIKNIRWNKIFVVLLDTFREKSLFWTRWDSFFWDSCFCLTYFSQWRKMAEKQEFTFLPFAKKLLLREFTSPLPPIIEN